MHYSNREMTNLLTHSILDNVNEMRKIDGSNMISFCIDAPKHCAKAAKLAETVALDYSKPKSIIVSGMGGSAIGGELLKDWARETVNVPLEVCRDYCLPAYADKSTLVFVVSYSGETEETLSSFLDAVKRKCMIITLSSGGALNEFAEKLGLPSISVPKGMSPRATLPYLFIPTPVIMEKLGLVSEVSSELAEAKQVLDQISSMNSPQTPTGTNPAKKLAVNVKGTMPVVYGFGFYRAVAQRFKTQFNENSKNPAKWEYFSELDHNEIVGWEEPGDLVKCSSVILIRDDNEPPEMRERIEVTKELMKQNGLKILEVSATGGGRIAKMLSVICMGDFASVYLAILKGVDPTPVRTIDLLKSRIEKTGFKEKVISELKKRVKS
jgi:glucose/mannose-6-phosphate isomerase